MNIGRRIVGDKHTSFVTVGRGVRYTNSCH